MVKAADRLQLKGFYEIQLKNAETGEILERRQIKNLVVNAGRSWVLNALQSGNAASAQTLQQIAVGTGTTAPAAGDTALVSENARKAIGTFDNTNTTATPPSFSAEVNFATNEANTTLGEIAIFNSSSGGTMFSRRTFSTINKASSNTLAISYVISN